MLLTFSRFTPTTVVKMSHQNITPPWKTKQTFDIEVSIYQCSPPTQAQKKTLKK